jgi:hypothetical protein
MNNGYSLCHGNVLIWVLVPLNDEWGLKRNILKMISKYQVIARSLCASQIAAIVTYFRVSADAPSIYFLVYYQPQMALVK